MKRHVYLRILVVALSCLLFLCACGEQVPQASKEKQEELAMKFLEQLRDEILPAKDDPEGLRELGFLVCENEYVRDYALLDEFIEDYEAGEDCALTAIFISKAYVVNRLEVEEGIGYYFRYAYDKNQPIAVDYPKLFTGAELSADEELGKTTLTLTIPGKSPVTFTFRLEDAPETAGGEPVS